MNNSRLMCELNPRSHVAEAFRILRTNLQFSTLDHSQKVLQVTSPGPAEGKSTVTSNLGIVMSQTGAKVIIVDCDLRWPDQHRFFNLPNEMGLTDVLMGSVELNKVLKGSGRANLKVVTCGYLPPNPSELLGFEKTREVLAQLSGMADIVLIDSPPILTVADATIISSIVDGCIIVIKSAKTKLDDVRHAKERLDKANARIIGTVLNSVDGANGYYSQEAYYQGRNIRNEVAAGKST